MFNLSRRSNFFVPAISWKTHFAFIDTDQVLCAIVLIETPQ